MPSCINHVEVIEGLNKCTRCAKTYCGDCLVELKGGFFCAGCKGEEVRDIQSGVPAGGEMRFAGFWIRLCAFIVDYIVFWVASLPFSFAMTSMGMQPQLGPDRSVVMPPGYWPMVLLIMGMGYSYHALMLQFKGQTLGKMAVRVKVVTPEGNPITAGQAWLRPVVELIGMIPLFATFWVIIFTKEKTSLHDLAVKTRVIRLNQ